MRKIIGIDLGTTNSCVAVVKGRKPIMISNGLGQLMTPSVVRFLENGDIIVGEHAVTSGLIDPKNTVNSIKRFIGRRYNEIMDIAPTFSFDVGISRNNLAMINIRGKAHSPQMISAMILKSLKESAESFLGVEVSAAVITVPAYFSDAQREATRQAGEIAKIEIKRIINEPTAAAIAYGLDKGDQKVAVFDLGGGTFDISILEMGDGVFEVKAISGDGFLGGDDFDNQIIDWVLEEIRYAHGVNFLENHIAMKRIKDAATKAKCELSELSEAVISLPFLGQKGNKVINVELLITRQKFEEIAEELFKRLAKPCEIALKNAGLSSGEIDNVILVGGATRMAKIDEIVKKIFGIEPAKSVNPEEAVALGAAIQGGVLAGDFKDVLLLDIIPHSLGVETEGGITTRLMEMNTTIPTQKSEIFTTSLDNQTSVEIHILEGESDLAISNRTLGRLILDGIPAAPRGAPQIEVTFDIDANGILNVSAKDKALGKEEKLRVQVSTGMSNKDIDDLSQKIPAIRIN